MEFRALKWDGHLESDEPGVGMNEQERRALAAQARDLRAGLVERGVKLLAASFVDNSGITRVKAVPVDRLETAAGWGIGASPCFDGFLFNDLPALTGPEDPGAVGDLRLHPDLDRLTPLSALPGWAWAPVDRYDQQGQPHPQDQRLLARDAVAQLAAAEYHVRLAFEVEWAVSDLTVAESPEQYVPATSGPGYGFASLGQRGRYLKDLVSALSAQGIEVEQVHPEYAPGQFELSVAAEDPVGAADTYVLVRETIRAVSYEHGLRASFSPKVVAGGVGNGGHIHLSLWKDGNNAFTGGQGPCGLTPAAESLTAGLLDHLPGLLAICAPSVASYLRLIPQHWAGPYVSWGLENREVALRLVPGSLGRRNQAANLEIKCVDQTANPYLVVAALLFAGMAGLTDGRHLPEPVQTDPALLSEAEHNRLGIRRLPKTLADALTAFENDEVLARGFGRRYVELIAGIRRAEITALADQEPTAIAAATRWVH